MMRLLKITLIALVVFGFTTSCFEDQDDNTITASEINDFIWKGMNAVYLYKDNVPDLANDRFSSNQEYADYLNGFNSPEDIFNALVYEDVTFEDRFSFLVSDYIALEQLFSGTTTSNGMEFGLRFVPGSNTEVFGYVRFVLPGTSAETEGVQRGDIFYAIDGTPITASNFNSLLSPDTYTINLATYNNNGTPDTADDTVTPGSGSYTLSKAEYTENPVFKTEILNVAGNNVGYLMYNGFTSNFDTQLNAAFGTLSGANVTDLVLDLRYNPGGSVNTAILLSSMITGQFTGDVFTTEEWNSDLQAAFQADNPESLINRFKDNDDGATLNSLNLNKVYILTTRSSASASELVINGLNPYINVVQIGANTAGKYQASITIYDSANFGRQNANPNHTYAIQPLVLKSLNSQGVTDFDDGLAPNISLNEDFGNLGVLGDPTEPLLAAAIADIATSRVFYSITQELQLIGDSNDLIPFGKEMYIDKSIPSIIKSQLNINE